MRLISSIYERGDSSRAHYVSFRSPTKRGVPKNEMRASKVVKINVYLHKAQSKGAIPCVRLEDL